MLSSVGSKLVSPTKTIAPGAARTRNLRLRRPSLYPIELRAQKEKTYALQVVAAIVKHEQRITETSSLNVMRGS